MFHHAPKHKKAHRYTHTPLGSSWLISVLNAWILFGFAVACFPLLCLNYPVSRRVNVTNEFVVFCHLILNMTFAHTPGQRFLKGSHSIITLQSSAL